MQTSLKKILDGMFGLVYSANCPFLKDNHACLSEAFGRKVCTVCHSMLSEDPPSPKELASLGVKVFSATTYQGFGKDLVLRLKFEEEQLAETMAEVLERSLREDFAGELGSIDFIVPVPGISSEERSWIPSLLLAQNLSLLTAKPCLGGALQKLRQTKMFELSLAERLEAAEGAYSLGEDRGALLELSGEAKSFLLVDDLVASGSTLMKCASLIKSCNAEHRVTCLTFASSEQD